MDISTRLECLGYIDEILDNILILKAKGDRFKSMERSLATALRRMWRTRHERALKDGLALISEKPSKDEAALLEDSLLEAMGPSWGESEDVRETMRRYIQRAYRESKRRWASLSLNLVDKRAIFALTRHNCYWLGRHYGEHIGPKIAEVGSKAIAAGLGRKALAKELKSTLGGVAPKDYQYWDVVSSAALVRSRSFGALSGMSEAGITEYKIYAMGDERMCPICGEMHGRTFTVRSAVSRMESAVGIKDPEEFKAAFPWQKEPPVGVSNSALAEAGMSMPPFHGRCRCIVTTSTLSAPLTSKDFPGVDPKEIVSMNEETRILQIKGMRMGSGGRPGWKYDRYDPKHGRLATRRFYDADGKASLDLDAWGHNEKDYDHEPHAHDWNYGTRAEFGRKMKAWEKRCVDAAPKRLVEKGGVPVGGEDPHFKTMKQFVAVLEGGGEIDFDWKGMDISVLRMGKDNIHVNDSPERNFHYKSLDEALDGYIIPGTNKTLREGLFELEIIGVPVWADENGNLES